MISKAVVVLLVMLLPRVAAGAPIDLNTWYEFSFLDAGTQARGCFPADPGGEECIPSSGTPTVFAPQPAWEFAAAAPALLTVVDAFIHGDGFTVFDVAVPIGNTSPPVADFGECGDDPVPCLADPAISRGFFSLAPGPHAITIAPYASFQGGGAAYFRVTAIPEPATWALLASALAALFLARRSKRAMWAAAAMAVMLPVPAAAQRTNYMTITSPARFSVISGLTAIVARHTHPTILPTQIDTVTFQISRDNGGIWTTAAELTTADADILGANPVEWTYYLPVDSYAPGPVLIRTRERVRNGLVGYSEPTEFVFNRPPVAVAKITHVAGTEYAFDGSASFDLDGRIERYQWDFGDGMNAEGKTVTHRYLTPPDKIFARLEVTDAFGATDDDYKDPKTNLGPECECESIELVTAGAALGPKGDASSAWPATTQADGLTLGKLHNNPSNQATPERTWVGFAFEIRAKVKGSPHQCKEIQVVKSTLAKTGVAQATCEAAAAKAAGYRWDAATMSCILDKQWIGATKDRNGDGVADFDVSTQALCTAAGGTWDATRSRCTLSFPRSGTMFIADEARDNSGTAYEGVNTYKEHPAGSIIMFDAVAFSGGANGSTEKADFIFLVRGTDRKYCYVAFTVDLERKAGEDKEVLTETDRRPGATDNTTADKVPGLPDPAP